MLLFVSKQTPNQILINMQTPREEGKTTVKGTCSGGSTRSKGTVSETRRSAEGWRWRASRTSDCAAGEDEVLLWSKDAIDLSANLADVFKEEGIEEATRKAAAATARRTEVMARCYAILRVALQDIVEGKVGGEGIGGVIPSCHLCVLLRIDTY